MLFRIYFYLILICLFFLGLFWKLPDDLGQSPKFSEIKIKDQRFYKVSMVVKTNTAIVKFQRELVKDKIKVLNTSVKNETYYTFIGIPNSGSASYDLIVPDSRLPKYLELGSKSIQDFDQITESYSFWETKLPYFIGVLFLLLGAIFIIGVFFSEEGYSALERLFSSEYDQ